MFILIKFNSKSKHLTNSFSFSSNSQESNTAQDVKPVITETQHNINATLASLQSQIPLSSLLFQNQFSMASLAGLSTTDLSSLQQALQAHQVNFQQQLQNYMLMHSSNNSPSVSAQAQAAAQILMQNQVSSATFQKHFTHLTLNSCIIPHRYNKHLSKQPSNSKLYKNKICTAAAMQVLKSTEYLLPHQLVLSEVHRQVQTTQ